MNCLKMTVGVLLALSVHSTASARMPDANFDKLAEEVSTKCDLNEGACESKYTATVYQGAKFVIMPKYRKIKAAALDQAQVWGDTILEGDYASLGKTRLDKVVIVKEDNKVVLYYITFSERAMDTGSGDCSYDEEKEKWIVGSCTKGRISESVAVSADFKFSTTLNDDYAQFYED